MKAIVLIATSALCSLGAFGAQIVLGQNAIYNPGAEVGLGSASGDDIIAAPGWISTGSFTVAQYGAPAAPLPANPSQFGTNFFSGGLGSETSTGTQTIDVSNIASTIDAHLILFTLSGYFGGYLTQPDNATLTAAFFDATNTVISSTTVGGITAFDRSEQTILLPSSGAGFIPVGTRSVVITLQMNRLQYTYNDGYADNLAFVATQAPEPATWGMLVMSIVVFLVARRRAARA